MKYRLVFAEKMEDWRAMDLLDEWVIAQWHRSTWGCYMVKHEEGHMWLHIYEMQTRPQYLQLALYADLHGILHWDSLVEFDPEEFGDDEEI